MSHPPPTPALADEGGAKLYWDSLAAFSDIGGPKSYNLIKISYTKIQNKTTTLVVFTVSIHTVPSPIYIYIYKIVHLYLPNQSAKPTGDGTLQVCGQTLCRRSRTSSSISTRIKTRAKLIA